MTFALLAVPLLVALMLRSANNGADGVANSWTPLMIGVGTCWYIVWM